MVGFPGPSPSADLVALIHEGVAGVIYFRRNLTGGPEGAARLTTALQAEARVVGRAPLLVAADQEGGLVARLRTPFTEYPGGAEALGLAGDERLAERFGRATAAELRAVGITVDFAPVLDVLTNPGNPVMARRAFGRDPDTVARLALAVARGLEAGQVASCAKHFPGHGDTDEDSHLALPVVRCDRARLDAVELPPFAAAVRAGVPMVMTAHVVYPALDPERPATLSPAIVDGLLRRGLGFEGVVVSDDLEMAAIADRFGWDEAVVKAVEAGCDLLLVCHRPDRQRAAVEALRRAVSTGRLSAARVEASLGRLARLAARYAPAADPQVTAPDPARLADVVGCARHAALAAEIAARAEAAARVTRHAAAAEGLDPTERGA
jgi:beta-N-acetylhexosaminidase